MNPTLTLPHFTFESLQNAQGLAALDHAFLEALQAAHPAWHHQLLHYRQSTSSLSKTEIAP